MKIANSITELIGNTPLLSLHHIVAEHHLNCRIWAKLECFNPMGSIKDRTAYAMIVDAMERDILKPGATIVEATSGNTGIGIAFVGRVLGFSVVIVMPDSMTKERIALLESLGAKVILTPGKLGMAGAIAKADELLKEISGSICLKQFENPANPKIHRLTTGEEIWQDTDGTVDILVAGIGTGGTITGTGESLKKHKPSLQVYGVEPEDSPVLNGGKPGPHGLQGIGAGFIPKTLNKDLLDDVLTVSTEEAYDCCRQLAALEGILVGISSGAALQGALRLGAKPENQGKNIVVIFPDGGERYLSLPLFQG